MPKPNLFSRDGYLRKILRHIGKNAFYLFAFPVAFFIIVPIYLYKIQNHHLLPTWYRTFTQISIGVWCSIIAGIIISWFIYLFQSQIRRLFGLSKTLTLRLPLMLASAPFLLAKKFRLFEKHNIDLDLDFRYAGIGALSDLNNNICDLAVASDIAIARFMNENYSFSVYSLPFVKIKNHIKILVSKNSEITEISMLNNGTIAYIKNSVHEDYIEFLETEKKIAINTIEAKGVMECFKMVIENKAKACIFWEPHYLSMENIFDLVPLDCQLTYEWFLCLVAKTEFIHRNTSLARQLFYSLKEAANICENDHTRVAENCITYMHPEFTGLDKDQLNSILVNERIDSHFFGIDSTLKKEYLSRLEILFDRPSKKYKAICGLNHYKWPIFGLDNFA
jgi:ABC-type nitrate/sulfonate/bicarbonate transport system substrate-binding protein